MKNWEKADDKAIVKAYLSKIGINTDVYMKYVGRTIRGGMLKYKEDGEFVSKKSILHKLGDTCILRIPLDPDFQRKKGRPLQGKLQKNACVYLGNPNSGSLGIVRDIESALSLLSLPAFADFQIAVCGTLPNFEKFTPKKKFERLVVFADDDFQTNDPPNPGLSAAINLVQRLIKETGKEAELCRPKRYEKIMRWNDLLRQELLQDSLEWGWEVKLCDDESNIDKFLYSVNGRQWGSIKIEEGVFWRFDSNGRMIRISNFMVHPEAVIVNPNGNQSIDCTLIHADGNKKSIVFNIEDLNEQTRFALKCKSNGDWGFIWSGLVNNFTSFLLFLHAVSRGKPRLKRVDYWGCLGGKVYFYSNAAISKDEIIELNDRRIKIASDEYLVERTKQMPYGKSVQALYRKGICNEERVEGAFRHIKSNGEAALALGFGIASMYLDHVIQEFGAFPFLGIFGYMRSAKTTLARMVMALFGFKLMLPPIRYSDSTEPGIAQGMETLGSIPYWIDEYNDGKLSRISHEFVKNIYSQSSAAIGSLEGAQTRAVKSSLILSGQVVSVDSAIRTRIITVRMSRAELRKDVISWIYDNREQLNLYGSLKIQQSLDEQNQQAYLKKIRVEMDALAAQGIDHRIALNYAVAICALDLFTGLNVEKLKQVVIPLLVEFEQDMEELSPVNTFFSELLNYYFINVGDDKTRQTVRDCIGVSEDKKHIHVRLQVLHSLLLSNQIVLDALPSLRMNLTVEHAAKKGRLKIGDKYHKGVYAIPVKRASEEMKTAAAEIHGNPELFDNNLRIV